MISSQENQSLSSSSLSFPISSMHMVYADLGSLSINTNYGVVSSLDKESKNSYAYKSFVMENGSIFPFMSECLSKRYEEHNMDDDMEGKGSYWSEEGENSEKINHNNTNFNDELENPNGSGKEEDNGQSSKCARGHWRPAEDSKLKELVALYGPQNWNLIAEKLEGRSVTLGERQNVIAILAKAMLLSFNKITMRL